MLVNFVVKNFGPFRDEAILTMTAQKGNEHPENYVETETNGRILTSAAIFGPNASGKTYIVKALAHLQSMVLFPGVPNTQIEHYNPFRLSKDTNKAPTMMNIRFIAEDVLYDYAISFNGERILTERLYHYPKGRRAEVFTRNLDAFDFGRSTGAAALISKFTSPNTTGIFAAAQFNNEICTKVHKWFLNDLMIITNPDENALLGLFINRIKNDEDLKKKAISAMKIADFPITDIYGVIKKKKVQYLQGLTPQIKGLTMAAGGEEMSEYELYLTHDVGTEGLTPEDKKFPIGLESAGTVRFLSMIVPIMDALTYGKTLIIDEFGQKLHCRVSEWIVEMFCDARYNTGGGQLIFNTQSTHLMTQDLFRRDQIYLVSKNEKGEAELFSISDFGERKDKVILASYLDGKYGAVPFIDEGTIL